MQAHFRSFSLAKIVFITQLVNKKFPFMLPSHNCIIIDSMFSFQGAFRQISLTFESQRDSMKSHFRKTSVNLFCMVESTGIEPVTSCLQGRRSPS